MEHKILAKPKIMCLRESYKKKKEKKFFASLKSLKNGVGSGVGSGSVSQRSLLRIRIYRIHLFLGLPGSGSLSQKYGSVSGSGSFYHHAKIVRKTLIPAIL
jgi:hypothetical protein